MAQTLTWTEPNRPEIPNGWPVLIQGNQGTAYESAQDYLDALQVILDAQASHPNPPPEE